MGLSKRREKFPARCFNAQNHWHLKWYNNRSLDVDPSLTQVYRVAAFVDYDKTRRSQSEYVLLRVGDLYMQYNRKKSFNYQTGEMPDKIVIVRESRLGTTSLEAGLDVDDRTYFGPENNEGLTLMIQVCNQWNGNDSIPDIIEVSIGYGETACVISGPAETGRPSPSPLTEGPTMEPTLRPSLSAPHERTSAPTTIISEDHPPLNDDDDFEAGLQQHAELSSSKLAMVILWPLLLLLLLLSYFCWRRKRNADNKLVTKISSDGSIEVFPSKSFEKSQSVASSTSSDTVRNEIWDNSGHDKDTKLSRTRAALNWSTSFDVQNAFCENEPKPSPRDDAYIWPSLADLRAALSADQHDEDFARQESVPDPGESRPAMLLLECGEQSTRISRSQQSTGDVGLNSYRFQEAIRLNRVDHFERQTYNL
jgi:hypothetical protein